ncbi:uracil nucleotide/cysteinyl leukotriene receptor isoform X1 [Anguilla rostrata]|uniref:uracil nucleotide/cysteinyl leukotriene receptor isoform X1 n=2 Tax=Anguilla rostrata TaxID=7938 RepID=UPI0030CCF37F
MVYPHLTFELQQKEARLDCLVENKEVHYQSIFSVAISNREKHSWDPSVKMNSSTMEVTPLFSNQSSESCGGETTTENLLFGGYYILVFLLALNGNGVALWIFSRQRGTSSPANVFLLHLAIADISYVIILPLRATYHLTGGHWPFGEVPCRVAGFLFYVNMYASLYFLACVAGDRYLAVVHAVRSLKVRRARYAHAISFSLWALVTVSMAPLLVSQQTSEVDGVTVCSQLYREKASRRALVSLAVAFTPPFLATLTFYLLIIQSLHRGSRLEPALKLKALRTIGLVLLIYVVCFLPYHASRAIFILGYGHPGISCRARRGLMLANRLTSSLTCLNGALDPLVYLFGAEKFRDSLQRLLCRDKAGGSGATSGELKGTHESSVSARSEF